MMKGFKQLLMKAQLGDQGSARAITELYQGLIAKESIVEDEFDEDLMQILYDTLPHCIQKFNI